MNWLLKTKEILLFIQMDHQKNFKNIHNWEASVPTLQVNLTLWEIFCNLPW